MHSLYDLRVINALNKKAVRDAANKRSREDRARADVRLALAKCVCFLTPVEERRASRKCLKCVFRACVCKGRV
jgi:hypothetical protein